MCTLLAFNCRRFVLIFTHGTDVCGRQCLPTYILHRFVWPEYTASSFCATAYAFTHIYIPIIQPWIFYASVIALPWNTGHMGLIISCWAAFFLCWLNTDMCYTMCYLQIIWAIRRISCSSILKLNECDRFLCGSAFSLLHGFKIIYQLSLEYR